MVPFSSNVILKVPPKFIYMYNEKIVIILSNNGVMVTLNPFIHDSWKKVREESH